MECLAEQEKPDTGDLENIIISAADEAKSMTAAQKDMRKYFETSIQELKISVNEMAETLQKNIDDLAAKVETEMSRPVQIELSQNKAAAKDQENPHADKIKKLLR